MDRLRRSLALPGLWIPLILAAPILWALLPGGIPNTADGPVHFIRSAEMVHAWQDGVLIPRWAENLGLGYGIPLFVYAPPLPYSLTAALHTLGLPLDAAFKGMMALAVLIAAYGSYRMGAALLGARAGAVSAAAFLYAPIMLRELFIQGNVAQYLAWTFPPWAAWAVLRLYAADGSRRPLPYVAALALALMGSLLSHNAAALIAMGMVAGLALVLFLATRNGRGLLLSAAGSVLGLALSAWFWVPALLEGEYVALHRIVASDFRPRFIALSELISLSPRLDTGAINPYFPLTLGAVQVWLGILGALLFVARLPVVETKKRSFFGETPFLARVTSSVSDQAAAATQGPSANLESTICNLQLFGSGIFFTLFAAFSAFMATAWSEPVWAVMPFVDLFEWPFRWHGFTAVGLAWLAAFVPFAIGRVHPRAGSIAAVIALLLLIGSALVNLYPHKLPPGRAYSPAEVVRFEAKTNAIGTTSLGEFNPIWVADVFNTSPLVEDYLAGNPIDRLPRPMPPGATGRQLSSGAHRQEFSVTLAEPATLTLNLLYFPGWRATIDGQPVAIRPHPESGLIDVDLPAGQHMLVLTFGGTPLRRAAAAVSIIGWLGLGIAAGFSLTRRRQARIPISDATPAADRAAIPAVALTVAALMLVQATQARPEGSRLQLHSPPDTALPASQPLRIDFEDRLRLLGVDLPDPVVAPGQALTLVTYWRALQPLDEDYSIFLHLDDPVTGETIATVDPIHPADIPTSGWATGLYVRTPLKLTVPDEADPIQYALRLGVVNRGSPLGAGDLLARADGAGDLYEAGRVWVSQHPAPQAPNGPAVRFGEDIALLSVVYDEPSAMLTLTWRATAPASAEGPSLGLGSIFVHLLDQEGNLLGQLDGAPYANRYPVSAWRPGQVIEDRRSLSTAVPDVAQIDRVAVGLYDPATGVRLPAYAEDGSRLPDDALVVVLTR